MTRHKHLKQLVRSRMTKTGESYAAARRQILGEAALDTAPIPSIHHDPHLPGNIPATTALRVLLTQAGIRDPRTGRPLSEALLFAIAGGIGIGAFSFLYEKEDFASFMIAGRHRWHDDLAYLRNAAERLGAETLVEEAASAPKAARQLAAMLDEHGPCIAWVDSASLSHRAMPEFWRGGGYHVITVYRIEGDDALIGDLSDETIRISLSELADARGRIKKQKNRLLRIGATQARPDLAAVFRGGLRACHDGLTGEGGVKGFTASFSLDVLRRWGEQLHGGTGKESWETRFPPGSRLWHGLTSIYDFIEHYGTGGGLCRSIFAIGLAEAAEALQDQRLQAAADRYAELGRGWSTLANAALPDHVPLFQAARESLTRKAELTNSGGDIAEIGAAWAELDQLAAAARREFPLTAGECADLRAELKRQVLDLYEGEQAAQQELSRLAG